LRAVTNQRVVGCEQPTPGDHGTAARRMRLFDSVAEGAHNSPTTVENVALAAEKGVGVDEHRLQPDQRPAVAAADALDPGVGVIEEILPPGVKSAEAFNDLLPSPLFAEEEALLTRSTDKRRREFATARACARRALGELGLPPIAVLPGERGAPQWPVGVVGSMTHCGGYRAAAVAWVEDLTTIGIDAEPALPLPHGVLGMITSSEERALLSGLADVAPAVCWDRLTFCAKEAVYKAWFPLTKRWLGFKDAVVEIDRDGTFIARLLVTDPRVVDGFTGRWLVRDGLLLAAIAVLPAQGNNPDTAPPSQSS
jgi:4'-phosphopantetheinyl transferase EntD